MISYRQRLLAVLFAASVPVAALAEPVSGFYAGARVGNGNMDDQFFDDESDITFGGLVGYQFNPYLGVEAWYSDLGEFDGRIDRGGDPTILFTAEPSSFGIAGVFNLPIGEQFNLYSLIGWHRWDFFDDRGPDLDETRGYDGDTDPTYGLGGRFDFGENWAVRAQFQRYEFGSIELDEFSVGAQYTFH